MAIGTGTALLGGMAIGGVASLIGTSQAAGASTHAADVNAAAQMEALKYLKEREKIPQALREQALQQLGGIYGLPGIGEDSRGGATFGAGNRNDFIESLRNDPFYQTLVSEGAEGVLRGASATGGLRSGGTSEALADSRMRALREVYGERIAGLQGLAGLPSYAPQIAQGMSNIGATQAGGILGAGQAWQQGLQNLTNIGLGGLGLGIQEGLI